jgi:hypothetical protein
MTRLFFDLQIARFNELYYQKRSAFFRKWAKRANVVSALAASLVLANLLTGPGTPLLGLGPLVWQILTGMAALSAAVGPVLGLWDKASQMDRAALGHSIVKDRIRRLLVELKLSDLQDSHLDRDREIDAVRSALSPLDEPPSEKLREICWEKTLEEFPSEKAWLMV